MQTTVQPYICSLNVCIRQGCTKYLQDSAGPGCVFSYQTECRIWMELQPRYGICRRTWGQRWMRDRVTGLALMQYHREMTLLLDRGVLWYSQGCSHAPQEMALVSVCIDIDQLTSVGFFEIKLPYPGPVSLSQNEILSDFVLRSLFCLYRSLYAFDHVPVQLSRPFQLSGGKIYAKKAKIWGRK